MEHLYYIRNIGCDDETCGLARISDEDFPKFKEFVENLNKNSSYGCMPKIYVYKIAEDLIREATDEDECYKDLILHLDDKKYALTTKCITKYDREEHKSVCVEGAEQVI